MDLPVPDRKDCILKLSFLKKKKKVHFVSETADMMKGQPQKNFCA